MARALSDRRPAGFLAGWIAIAFTAAACAANSEVASAADDPVIALELNKLETIDKGCRAYMVVDNRTDATYEAYKLDLVLFQGDGVIGRRFSLDLAPVRAQKKTVKLFEIEGMACDKIGQFLINDVIDCKSDKGEAKKCLQHLSTSTRTNAQLSK